MKLSKKLRLLREEKGITQEALADKLKIGIQSVRNYENDSKNRIPSTIQLKMLKDFYNVTYEYLLDENCENKQLQTVDIGKKLMLSDSAIDSILNLQYSIGLKNADATTPKDFETPKVFSNLLENIDLAEYVLSVREYQILNEIYSVLQYFCNFNVLNPYIADCMNKSISLKDLEKLFDEKRNLLNDLIKKSLFIPFAENGIKEFDVELKKLKKFFKTKPTKKLNVRDVEAVSVFVEGISLEFSDQTERTIKYTLFELTDLLKTDLEDNYGKMKNIALPSEYKNMMKKEGK